MRKTWFFAAIVAQARRGTSCSRLGRRQGAAARGRRMLGGHGLVDQRVERRRADGVEHRGAFGRRRADVAGGERFGRVGSRRLSSATI